MKWVAFPLHPYIPPEGMTLEELLAGRNIDIGQMAVHLKKTADKVGLPINAPKRSYNTRLAHEISKWAEKEGKGDLFHELIFKAYFVDGIDISDMSALFAIAGSIGLKMAPDTWENVKGPFGEEVDKDFDHSHEMMIMSVPTFMIGQNRLVGAQPYEALKKFLLDNSNRK